MSSSTPGQSTQKAIRTALGLFVVLGLLVGWGRPAHADKEVLDRLMRESGLNDQIAAMPDLLLQQSLQAIRQQAAPRGFIDRFQLSLRSTHSAEALGTVVGTILPTKITLGDANAVLEWLESPLGRRITALEKAASTAEGYAHFEAVRQDLLRGVSPARRRMLEQLSRNTDALDSNVRLLMNYQATFLHALRSHTGQTVAGQHVESVLAELESSRSQLTGALRPLVRDQFIYTYRGLSDEALQRYVGFTATPEARRYHAAAFESLEAALISAARHLGDRLLR